MKTIILSDIHGNLPALKKVLEKERLEYDNIWVLGDMTGYGPFSNECVLLLKRKKALMLAGNHDLCLIGKEPVEIFSENARESLEKISLTEKVINILENLPAKNIQEEIMLVHGAPSNPAWGYILSRTDAYGELLNIQERGVFFGHTHVPAVYIQQDSVMYTLNVKEGSIISLKGKKFMINPGSLGQPRDGNPSASYILFDTSKLTVEFHRCPYPQGKLQRTMRKQGYSEKLIKRLEQGL